MAHTHAGAFEPAAPTLSAACLLPTCCLPPALPAASDTPHPTNTQHTLQMHTHLHYAMHAALDAAMHACCPARVGCSPSLKTPRTRRCCAPAASCRARRCTTWPTVRSRSLSRAGARCWRWVVGCAERDGRQCWCQLTAQGVRLRSLSLIHSFYHSLSLSSSHPSPAHAHAQVLQDGGPPERQLLLPLAVAMAQQLDYVLYASSARHIKEVAELHDRVNETALQVRRRGRLRPWRAARAADACSLIACCRAHHGSATAPRASAALKSCADLRMARAAPRTRTAGRHGSAWCVIGARWWARG